MRVSRMAANRFDEVSLVVAGNLISAFAAQNVVVGHGSADTWCGEQEGGKRRASSRQGVGGGGREGFIDPTPLHRGWWRRGRRAAVSRSPGQTRVCLLARRGREAGPEGRARRGALGGRVTGEMGEGALRPRQQAPGS